MNDWLTAIKARETVFGTPPMGNRGCNENRVDAFLDTAEAAIGRPDRPR